MSATHTNPPLEELGGLPSSEVLTKAFAGARLVKGFNHPVAAKLEQDPSAIDGRRIVFLASDDDGAVAEIGELADRVGFAPVKLGSTDAGQCSSICRANLAG